MGKFNKFDAIGVLFGLLLYYIWFFVIFLFQNIFLARKEVIHGTAVYHISNNDLVTWLSDGLLLFYILFGHYIITKKGSEARILKSMILGFTAWLAVLTTLNLAGFSISSLLQKLFGLHPFSATTLSVLIGYCVMICFVLLIGYLGQRKAEVRW